MLHVNQTNVAEVTITELCRSSNWFHGNSHRKPQLFKSLRTYVKMLDNFNRIC